ncbi:hypothetical protein ACF09E_28135 [Streptomyces sp. NPDC014891]|uniref:hypothetical protein n=1 Tax=Streptomyces sp. NPDC014891 TaxID=3364929 RepID=UPI0036F66717
MISEPELDGDTSYDTTEVLTEEQARRTPGPRRPWLWAVGGAVLASAVWGGGLYAYEQRKEPGPDLGGYAPVEGELGLCKRAELKALGAILGKRTVDGYGPPMDEPAISEGSCSATFGPEEASQTVEVTYTLHKVIDPGHEFEARARQAGVLRRIDGIGEQAWFDDASEQGGTLWVLDGQAEIRLQLFWQVPYDENGNPVRGAVEQPDLSGIDVPMSQDALALMARLKE